MTGSLTKYSTTERGRFLAIADWCGDQHAANFVGCDLLTISNLRTNLAREPDLIVAYEMALSDYTQQRDAKWRSLLAKATMMLEAKIEQNLASMMPEKSTDISKAMGEVASIEGRHATENARVEAKKAEARHSGLVLPAVLVRTRNGEVKAAGTFELELDDSEIPEE